MFDQNIVEVIKLLNKAGYEAYLVGGAVRDCLLGMPTHDYDVCTNALPNQIKEVFKEYVIFNYGEKFGTIGIKYADEIIEITTFRSETDYKDNRHPDEVKFNATLETDCTRRDFTINALAYDVQTGQIVDKVNGQADLENKIIRCVGNPHKRFEEDALRIMRAIRFSARLDFSIEDETKKYIHQDYKLLANISKERLTEELGKILLNGIENVIEEYFDVFSFIIPELKKVNTDLLKTKTDDLVIKLYMLLSEVNDINKALNNLRFSKNIQLRCKSLFLNKDINTNNDIVNTRMMLHHLQEQYYIDINNLHKLLNIPYTSEEVLNEAISLGYSSKILAIDGKKVRNATLFKGKEISDCIEELLLLVITNKLANTKETLTNYLFEKYGKTNSIKKKMEVLHKINDIFKENKAMFSIGASAMLYFRGIVDYFGDFDISVSKEDYALVKDSLEALSTVNKTKWGYINCLKIDDVYIDLLVKDYNVLKDVSDIITFDNMQLNLESLEYWLEKYTKLERFTRVEQIKDYLEGKHAVSSNN